MIEVETVVIGGALSGLMAGYLLKRNYVILEAAPRLDFNLQSPFFLHAPIDWLPTNWKKISVIQQIYDGKEFRRAPTIKDMVDYSKKISHGKIMTTSLIFMDGKSQTGYLPIDGRAGTIIQNLYEEVKEKVRLGEKVLEIDIHNKIVLASSEQFKYKNLISTMPLPILLKMIKHQVNFEFESTPVYIKAYTVPSSLSSEVYQILYMTNPSDTPQRISLMNDMIFVESNQVLGETENANLIAKIWGLSGLQMVGERVIKPGKFHPVEKVIRKNILGRLTAQHGIYCLGRYAVWDYKRIDHIAEDAKFILTIIQDRVIS